MADIEKMKSFMKCLICLFSAAAVLLLTGGAKKAFLLHSLTESAAKVQASALLYVPSSENRSSCCLWRKLHRNFYFMLPAVPR